MVTQKKTKHAGRDVGLERASGEAAASPQAADAGLRVQLKGASWTEGQQMLAPPRANVQAKGGTAPVQRKKGEGGAVDVHATARAGTAGSGGALPHADKIQASFGRHDVSSVQAYSGGAATQASAALGAEAYATGDKVAFAGSPSLHTAAHEAAHVVQQRAGVSLSGGVGKAGDRYEQHASAVADRVAQGRSAQGLLDKVAGGGSGGAVQAKGDLQFVGHSLDKPLPADAETPAHLGGRGKTDQRKYTPAQYIKMWEKAQGRKMTAQEKKTLEAGCIGITAINVGRNPPLDRAYDTFEQGEKEMIRLRDIVAKHPEASDGQGGKLGDWKVVLFAKMFFSNQQKFDYDKVPKDPKKSAEENWDENMKANRAEMYEPDPKAFPVHPKTGKVDMTGYDYRHSRPRFERNPITGKMEDKKKFNPKTGKMEYRWHVNFDYGFWDEKARCFWHANHCEPGMQVYQSTKDKFQKGYVDFSRVIYCVAFTKNYDPGKAATGS